VPVHTGQDSCSYVRMEACSMSAAEAAELTSSNTAL
jgi:hypothetical protein